MINLKDMYKNSKYGVLVKTFLFLTIVLLSLGVYFCFAPKNEVSAGNDTEYEFKINFKRADDNSPDLFSGSINVDYYGAHRVMSLGTRHATMNDDGSWSIKFKVSEIGGQDNIDTSSDFYEELTNCFSFYFFKGGTDQYSQVDSLEMQVENEFSIANAFDNGNCHMWSGNHWIDNSAAREVTVKLAYPAGAPKYTKFKINGSAYEKECFMNKLQPNSANAGILQQVQGKKFWLGGPSIDAYSPVVAYNTDLGIVVFESKEYSNSLFGSEFSGFLINMDFITLNAFISADGIDKPNGWESRNYANNVDLYYTEDNDLARASNLFKINLETEEVPEGCTFTLQGGNSSALGAFVQSYSAKSVESDGHEIDSVDSTNVAENDQTKNINIDMYSNENYVDVTLKARDGMIITGVTGENLVLGTWNRENGTYTFRITSRPNGNRATYTVTGQSSQCTINLQGDPNGASYENQNIAALIEGAKVYLNSVTEENFAGELTSEEITAGTSSLPVNVKDMNDKIIVQLTAVTGIEITNVSGNNAEDQTSDNWDFDNKSYVFTINGYPGETVTYTVQGGFINFPISFYSEDQSDKFKVYLTNSTPPEGSPTSVNLHYNEPTYVTIKLDSTCSRSNIRLAGEENFGGASSAKIKVTLNGQSTPGECTAYPRNLIKGGSYYLGDNRAYDVSEIEYIYTSDIQYASSYGISVWYGCYIIKVKNQDIRVFRSYNVYSGTSCHLRNEITDQFSYISEPYDKSFVGSNIECYEKRRENDEVIYEVTLKQQIKIDPTKDKFKIHGIEYNNYDVTIKCDETLPIEIIKELRLKYPADSNTLLTFLPTDSENPAENGVKVVVRADALSSNWKLDYDHEHVASALTKYYFNWFQDAKLSESINDADNIISFKDGDMVTLKPVTDDCIIVLKKPDTVSTAMNFKGDDKCVDLINIYNVSSPDSSPGAGDRAVEWKNFGSGKVAQDVVDTSYIEQTKFYYVIKASENGFITDDEDKKSVLNSLGLSCEGGSDYSVSVNKDDIDQGFIRATVTVNMGVKPPSDGFSIDISGVKYPERNAIFVSDENMAKFTPMNGWNYNITEFPDYTKDPEPGKKKSQGFFDYNNDLAFTVMASDNYEIYNINENLKITRTGTETEVQYDAQEYTKDGKVYYEITVYKVKYNITVNAKEFDPLHKVVTFNNIEGLNYYAVEPGSVVNERGTEGDYKADSATLGNMIYGKCTISTGDDFYFAVKAAQGYDLFGPDGSGQGGARISGGAKEIKVDGADYKLYKIPEIGRDYTISGSINKLKYNVKFEKYTNDEDPDASTAVTYKKDGVPVTTLEVEYGDTISFEVAIGEKYNKSKFKIKDKDGDVEINLVNGKYSVVNITGDKTITVENISINQYNVNFAKSDAIDFLNESGSKAISGVQSIAYNEGIKFKVEAKTGYAITDQMEVVSISESGVRKVITKGSDGCYSLTGIKEDYEISIENVENIIFKVTLEPTEGVTYINEGGAVISGTSKVKYGNNFEFSVSIGDAYDDSIAGMYIIVNGGKSNGLGAQKLATGRYIVPNITEDVVIKVGNIRKNSYNVTLNKVDGMDYYNFSKKVINGDNNVNHGDSFSFKVGLHSAYDGSKIKVMLGNEELKPNESGFYTVPKVIENKTVTVIGVEENEESKVVNTINNLPSNVTNLEDVDAVIAATKDYEKLSDEQKHNVSNIDDLKRLQEQVKEFHHVSNDVRISGVDWHIKLVAVPISFDKEACTRIYKKLNSEYIVSLYDIYLWDVINDVKYTLPEGQEAVITLPKPDLTYFEKPTGIHEKDGGKISYLSLNIGSDIVRFTTDSFSPMGVIANRSLAPGRSSLLDAADANIGLIKNYALSTFGSGGSGNKNSSYSDIANNENDSTNLDGNTGNISEKFRSRNNPVTAQGSAIRLALVLMLLILLAIIIIIIIEGIKRRKKEKGD